MAATLIDTTRVSRTPDQPWCDLGNEVVVLRVQDSTYYRFEDSARAIWLLLDEPRRVDELTSVLASEYEDAGRSMVGDVTAFLTRCADLGLVSHDATDG
ncbi:MAG: PqqD family protein [Gemmatimonadota bacterium]